MRFYKHRKTSKGGGRMDEGVHKTYWTRESAVGILSTDSFNLNHDR